MFKISPATINKALFAVSNANKYTTEFNEERKRLMLEMAEENVGRFGVEKRDQQIAMMEDALKLRIDACKASVEAARADFLELVDIACNADGSKLNMDDIALMNANALVEDDIYRMIDKHMNNFTMLKAIAAFIDRNNITNSVTGNKILIPGLYEEKELREFARIYFDKCISACMIPYGYEALFVNDRYAVMGMLRTMNLLDSINIDEIYFKDAE